MPIVGRDPLAHVLGAYRRISAHPTLRLDPGCAVQVVHRLVLRVPALPAVVLQLHGSQLTRIALEIDTLDFKFRTEVVRSDRLAPMKSGQGLPYSYSASGVRRATAASAS